MNKTKGYFSSGFKLWPLSHLNINNNNNNTNSQHTFGSSVAVQKLRESKWFGPEEQRILCAVLECGFIVEIREENELDGWFGVVICKTTKDKKPKPENIEIHTMKTSEGRRKHIKMTLDEIWKRGCQIRINNFGDKENVPHSEKDIKNQISFSQKTKRTWHNSQHFAYWCRYGDRQEDVRRKQMSECVKWGSVGMNAGMLLLKRPKAKSIN